MIFIPTVYAATEATTASAGGVLGVVGTLGLNGGLFLAQLINFAILAVVLWYLLFKPLTRFMAERSKRIAAGLDTAKAYDEKLQGIEAERKAVVAKADTEARRILTAAQGQAQKVQDKARAEAEGILAEARKRSEREAEEAKRETLSEVRAQAADLVVMAAEKVLRERIDVKADKALIERALKEADV